MFQLAQLSVTAISLTYSIDDGTNYRDTFITEGNVTATNFDCYFSNSTQSECPGDVPSQATAQRYGELSQRTGSCTEYTTLDDILESTSNPAYYCRRKPENQEFAYRFKEWNPQDNESNYPSFSNRTITVSSGPCFEYEEVGSIDALDDLGNMAATEYTYKNATFNSTVVIPKASEGLSGTTFVYRGIKLPRDAETYACGARCIKMFAYKKQGPNERSKFYECPITVSLVSNNVTKEHHIQNRVARVAAASIALQGRWFGTFENQIWKQYQFYTARYVDGSIEGAMKFSMITDLVCYSSTRWDIHGKSRDEVGATMAEFALGSIVTMAELNPRTQIRGRTPHLGSRLRMFERWHSIVALLVSIFVAHTALTLHVAYTAAMSKRRL